MTRTRSALALVAGAAFWLAATASAFCQTPSPKTVQGRLGPQPGHVEDIPFTALTSQFQLYTNIVVGATSTTVGDFALWSVTTGKFLEHGGAPGAGVLAVLVTELNASGGLVGYSGHLGTPTQGVLTNATELPVATGLSGLGTRAATALGNPAGGKGGLALNSQLASYLALAGGTMSGNIAMGGNNLTGVGAITATTYNGLPLGSSDAEGVLQCDGSNKTCSGAKVTAIGTASAATAPLTTAVTGGTNDDLLGVPTSGCGSGSPCLSQVAMTAPLVGHTPQGTGGVATTVSTELDRTIWVNDYGAVCNGTTDDHVAFQNAINEGESTGYPVRFIGNCAVSTTLSITSTVDFGGVSGVTFSGPANLVSTNAAIDIIYVDTAGGNPVYFHDFSMSYSSAATNGTAAIRVSSPSSENAGSKFERLVINGNVGSGLVFTRASGWNVSNSTIAATYQAFIVANQNVGDSGDSTINSNLIEVGSGGIAILYQSSGGLRIINNKINGTSIGYGIQMALASGVTTADLFITGNSIEGISTTGVAISLARAGSTGGFGTIMITGNELSGEYCLSIPTDANGVWLNNLTATGNTCLLAGTTSVAFAMDSIQGATVTSNFVQGSAGTNQVFNIGSHGLTAGNCAIGITPHLAGTFTASTLGPCTAIAPD